MNNMTFRPVGTAVAAAALAVVAVMLVMTVPASAQSPPRCAWYGGETDRIWDAEINDYKEVTVTVAYRIDNNCSGEYTEGTTIYPSWMGDIRQPIDQQDRNRGVTGYGMTPSGSVYLTTDKDHAGYANDRSLRLGGTVSPLEVVFRRAGSGPVTPLYVAFDHVEILADGTRVTELRYRLPDGTVVTGIHSGPSENLTLCLRPSSTLATRDEDEDGTNNLQDADFHACKVKHQVTYGGSTYELTEAVDPYQPDGRVLVNIECISGECPDASPTDE